MGGMGESVNKRFCIQITNSADSDGFHQLKFLQRKTIPRRETEKQMETGLSLKTRLSVLSLYGITPAKSGLHGLNSPNSNIPD